MLVSDSRNHSGSFLRFVFVVGLSIVLASCTSAEDDAVGDESDAVDPIPIASVEDGDQLGAGSVVLYEGMWVHCGAGTLGSTLNGSHWRAVEADPDAVDWVPDGWQQYVDEQEEIDLVLTVESERSIQVRPAEGGPSYEYEPTEESSQCD